MIAGAYIALTRRSKFADDPVADIAIVSGLALVVFLTYFVLVKAGFKAAPPAVVEVPRMYAWSVLCAIVVLVFGVLFYLLDLRS